MQIYSTIPVALRQQLDRSSQPEDTDSEHREGDDGDHREDQVGLAKPLYK